MNKPTPGKWYTGNSVFGDFGVFTDADIHPNMICSVKKSIDDARLIAAAPDMLEALISVMRYRFGQSEGISYGNIESVIEAATGQKIEEVMHE